jgi:hypothetical protein
MLCAGSLQWVPEVNSVDDQEPRRTACAAWSPQTNLNDFITQPQANWRNSEESHGQRTTVTTSHTPPNIHHQRRPCSQLPISCWDRDHPLPLLTLAGTITISQRFHSSK